MRAVIVAFVSGAALAAVSAQAAPLPPDPAAIEFGAVPPIELVAQGCGWGWHGIRLWDRRGRWHFGAVLRTGSNAS